MVASQNSDCLDGPTIEIRHISERGSEPNSWCCPLAVRCVRPCSRFAARGRGPPSVGVPPPLGPGRRDRCGALGLQELTPYCRYCGESNIEQLLKRVLPWTLAGKPTAENLKLRYAAHNRHAARRYFGKGCMLRRHEAQPSRTVGGANQRLEVTNLDDQPIQDRWSVQTIGFQEASAQRRWKCSNSRPTVGSSATRRTN